MSTNILVFLPVYSRTDTNKWTSLCLACSIHLLIQYCDVNNTCFSQQLSPKQVHAAEWIKSEQKRLEIAHNTAAIGNLNASNIMLNQIATNASTNYTAKSGEKAKQSLAEIKRCNKLFKDNQATIADLTKKNNTCSVELATIESNCARFKTKANNDAVSIALGAMKLENDKTKYDYRRVKLPVPESLLDEQTIAKWRSVQMKIRQSQYMQWVMCERNKKNAFTDKVNELWNGSDKRKTVENEIAQIKKKYDAIIRDTKSEKKSVLRAVNEVKNGLKNGTIPLPENTETELLPWVSFDGKVILAKYVKSNGFEITLEMEDGTKTTFPMNKLWVEDKNSIKSLDQSLIDDDDDDDVTENESETENTI